MKQMFLKIGLISIFIIGNLTNTFSQDNSRILWSSRWSNDSKFIAIGGSDEHLRIYSTDSFKLYRSYFMQNGVFRMEWHPTKNILAIAGGEGVTRMLDLDNHKMTVLEGYQNGSRAIGWNRNGEYLACGDLEGNLVIWNEKGNLIRTIKKENTYTYVGLDWNPKKDEIIVLGKYARVYDLEGNLLQKFEHRKEEVLQLCVQWHPSGKFFVIGDYGDNQKKYAPFLQFRSKKYKLKTEIDASKAEYRNIRWTNDGEKLATASDALRIWSKKGKLLFTGKSDQLLWGIDWSPSGEYIVTSSGKGQIIVWNNKAEIVRRLE